MSRKMPGYSKKKCYEKAEVYLDVKSLETIYLTFIRPLLEYADIVLGNCTNYEKLELDKVQTDAARVVTGSTKIVSLHVLFDEVN